MRQGPAIKGPVILPEDATYEAVRTIWNGSIARRPAVFACCLDEDDVAVALAWARERGLPVSVRGGGHNVAGTALCDGGVCVDLQLMKRVIVDPAARRVRVEPGVLLGELDAMTQVHGLAVPAGINSLTGIAGLTLGGGIGWLHRRHGLTCDHLVSARMVLADGSRAVASAEADADLHWAIRGGGGNFGIVTEFDLTAVALGPQVFAGAVLFAAEDAAEAVRWYRGYAAEAPDELTTILNFRTAPPAPWIPQRHHGRDALVVAGCWAGEPAEGERHLAPLRQHGEPLADAFAVRPFTAFQQFFNATVPPGWGYYWKSCYTPAWSDAAVDTLLAHAWRKETGQSYTIVPHLGGAIRHVPGGATAFEGRDAEFAININAVWTDVAGGPRDVEWTRAFFAAMEPHSTGGVYVNFLSDEGEARVRAAYGSNWERLAALKARYDPENVFRLNQNIAPARQSL
jgi:FAD/FMN-containing dehydrogenase